MNRPRTCLLSGSRLIAVPEDPERILKESPPNNCQHQRLLLIKSPRAKSDNGFILQVYT